MGAAEELFGLRGFANVSIDEITARAGVAKGTFYNHFADKADIANHIALEIRTGLRERIGEMKSTSTDPARHLAIAMSLFLHLAIEQPNRALILVSLINDPTDVNSPMNAPVRLTLHSGEASGRFRLASIEASLIMVIGMVSAGIRNLIEQPTRAPSSRITDLVVHALRSLGLEWDDAHATAAESVGQSIKASN
ncbi:helix-turn-helix domain-containing protein [Aquidulcibacter sp.]|jgi:AcrR family transcriptional regulator|uniref:TetR/AcrR family transcriptional regulator n=1 Tax=Aquidulcibacter sp. TaxID=2052990 RepID=UPI0028AC4ABC|nr:helix-turn-helix domain-containing protein [Aquidulcibacter sp.]